MMNKFDAQILVRVHNVLKQCVADFADEHHCSIPEWIRKAILEKLERDINAEVEND
ncbi:MAG: hypothetical protein HRT92_03160 [Piscirickettsiaceae bacterium]|nr:hypothetical protein [Piscirickettsiaceae bacterium]